MGREPARAGLRLAFVRRSAGPGVDLCSWTTEKFKTTTVRVLLRRPLAPEATENALLPAVLRRGTRRLPESIAVARRLDDLYGAEMRADVMKVGEEQVLIFHLEVPSGSYLQRDDPLPGAVDLLADVLFDPLEVDGGLSPDYVRQEQENLRRRIQGLYSDKAHYAHLRLTEEMCPGEAYATPRLGRVEDVDRVSPKGLLTHWREVLRTAPLAVYVVGDLSADRAEQALEGLLRRLPARDPKAPPLSAPHRAPAQPRQASDRQRVQQGKLAMGFTTGRLAGDPGYPALVMMNGIYGGYSHSKLFQEVREKNSLAYYAYSQIDGMKGLMFVQSGIEFANRARTEEIVLEQLEAMRRGEFTDREISDTMLGIANQIRQSQDAPSEAIMADFELRLTDRPTEVPQRIAALEAVQRDEIVAAAQEVQLDTVYFLDGEDAADGHGA